MSEDDTGWTVEDRERFAEVARQEAEIMERKVVREERSQLELRIISRKAALYNKLAMLEQRREISRNDIEKLRERYLVETTKIQEHIESVTSKMREAQDEIDQANLALRAINTGAQET